MNRLVQDCSRHWFAVTDGRWRGAGFGAAPSRRQERAIEAVARDDVHGQVAEGRKDVLAGHAGVGLRV